MIMPRDDVWMWMQIIMHQRRETPAEGYGA